ncbi:hypothetical protein Tco_0206757 [Tanacetum coccineum]
MCCGGVAMDLDLLNNSGDDAVENPNIIQQKIHIIIIMYYLKAIQKSYDLDMFAIEQVGDVNTRYPDRVLLEAIEYIHFLHDQVKEIKEKVGERIAYLQQLSDHTASLLSDKGGKDSIEDDLNMVAQLATTMFNSLRGRPIQLPVGVNDSRLEDKIIQHLAAAATMGRTHHVRQREGSRNRSVTHKALKTCILQVWSSQVIHVIGFDPHTFTHFRDERKRRRSQVTKQIMDEKLGRTVTRVVPQVVMHSCYHYGEFSDNFTGLELEDGGGRGTLGHAITWKAWDHRVNLIGGQPGKELLKNDTFL